MAKKKTITGIFWGAAFIFGILFAHGAAAATLYLSPASGSYLVGHTFTVGVYVSSPDMAMNAAQGTLSFPTDTLEVISLTKTDSVVTLWVQDPSFSNKDGAINFGGVVVNPGFQGAGGKVLGVTFRVKNPGVATISFSSGSVLANDGKGTNILAGMRDATVTLTAPTPSTSPTGNVIKNSSGLPQLAITSDPPTKDGDWYNINNITFSWSLPAAADSVSYALSNDPGYVLPQTVSGLAKNASYALDSFTDGKWYFYLSFESNGVWAPVAMRSFQLDRTPPEPFVIVEKDSGVASSDTTHPAFQWSATDKTSGVVSYEARIGDGDWFDPAAILQGSLYVLPDQSPANSRTLTVRAYDRARNVREESINFRIAEACPEDLSWYSTSWSWSSARCLLMSFAATWGWWWIVAIVLLLALLGWLLYRMLSWRRLLRGELADFKSELRRDLRHLEDRVDVGVAKGTEVDLRPSHLAARKRSLEETAEHLAEDVQKEIKKIEKL